MCTIGLASLGRPTLATAKDELLELVSELDDDSAANVLDHARRLLAEEDEPPTERSALRSSRLKWKWPQATHVTLDRLER